MPQLVQAGTPVTITSFPAAANVGLAVTSQSAGALNVSTFTGASVSSSVTGSPAQMFVTPGVQAMSAPLVLTQDLSIVPPAGTTLTISSGISEASPGMALSLDGPGTLILGGTNSYSGGTAVNAGTLIVTGGSALPSGTALSAAAGGVLVFDPSVGARGAGSGRRHGRIGGRHPDCRDTPLSHLLSGTVYSWLTGGERGRG